MKKLIVFLIFVFVSTCAVGQEAAVPRLRPIYLTSEDGTIKQFTNKFFDYVLNEECRIWHNFNNKSSGYCVPECSIATKNHHYYPEEIFIDNNCKHKFNKPEFILAVTPKKFLIVSDENNNYKIFKNFKAESSPEDLYEIQEETTEVITGYKNCTTFVVSSSICKTQSGTCRIKSKCAITKTTTKNVCKKSGYKIDYTTITDLGEEVPLDTFVKFSEAIE